MAPQQRERTGPFTVLHISQPTVDGVARVVTNLVEEQVGRGWRVVLACPNAGWLSTDAVKRGAQHLEWKAMRNPNLSVISEATALRQILTSVDPDLVHLHSSKAGLVGRLVLRGRAVTVFQGHGWSFHPVCGLMRKVVVRWEVFAARWTHLLICESEGEKEEGVRVGVQAQWAIAPNSVDIDHFRPPSDTERRASRARVGTKGPTAVCVGRLCPAKGQDALLDAWRSVLRAVPNAELFLVGGSPSSDSRLPGLLPARLPPHVRLVGQQDDVRPWLRAADVVVAPSRWDTHSIAILEAMACGRSLVATDVAGARESVSKAGAIVPVDDRMAMSRAIVTRLMDADLRECEGRAARARVESLFSARVCVHRIGDLYSLAMAPSSIPHPRARETR